MNSNLCFNDRSSFYRRDHHIGFVMATLQEFSFLRFVVVDRDVCGVSDSCRRRVDGVQCTKMSHNARYHHHNLVRSLISFRRIHIHRHEPQGEKHSAQEIAGNGSGGVEEKGQHKLFVR